MNVIQIVSIALISTFIIILFKQYRPEFAILISLLTCAFILVFSFEKIKLIISMIENLINNIEINKEFFAILLKVTGIAYIIEFASNLCADAGEKAVASKIEFAGKIIIVTMSIPIVETLIETITEVI